MFQIKYKVRLVASLKIPGIGTFNTGCRTLKANAGITLIILQFAIILIAAFTKYLLR